VLIRPESVFAGTYAGMVRDGNPNLVLERQRLLDEGVSAAEIDERLREVIFSQFLPDDESRAIDRLNEYLAVGVTHVIVARPPPYDFKGIERFLTHVGARVGT